MADVSRAFSSGGLLTTRLCADYMGFTQEWVRKAIAAGVAVDGGHRVKLEAEIIVSGERRRVYRIHLDKFIAFLQAIGWQQLPLEPGAGAAHN